jgi:hypothetical protein
MFFDVVLVIPAIVWGETWGISRHTLQHMEVITMSSSFKANHPSDQDLNLIAQNVDLGDMTENGYNVGFQIVEDEYVPKLLENGVPEEFFTNEVENPAAVEEKFFTVKGYVPDEHGFPTWVEEEYPTWINNNTQCFVYDNDISVLDENGTPVMNSLSFHRQRNLDEVVGIPLTHVGDTYSPRIDYKFEAECRERRFDRTREWVLKTSNVKALRNQWVRLWKAYNLSKDRCVELRDWSTVFFTKQQRDELVKLFNEKGIYARKDPRSVDCVANRR